MAVNVYVRVVRRPLKLQPRLTKYTTWLASLKLGQNMNICLRFDFIVHYIQLRI